MTRLAWAAPGERYFELGVDRGVLYVDGVATPWNGLVSVDESPSGGETRPYYYDGVKYMNRPAREEFEATISAFYSPREFDKCDGSSVLEKGVFVSQQRRRPFGLSYRTRIGNDIEGVDAGYKIHIIYNATAKPTQRSYTTVGADPELMTLSWGITTKPVPIPGMAPSSHIVIDTTQAPLEAVEVLEHVLYGDEANDGRLPLPIEIAEIFVAQYDFEVIDNLDGTFTINGSPEAVRVLDDNIYEINSDTVVMLGSDTAEVSD